MLIVPDIVEYPDSSKFYTLSAKGELIFQTRYGEPAEYGTASRSWAQTWDDGSAAWGKRRQVAHLNHERCESALAALRVHLALTDERRLALSERDPLVISSRDPTAAGKSGKDLTEACFVWADETAGLEVQDVRVRFAFSLSNLD